MACGTIGYLRDAWSQYWREDVVGGGVHPFRVEVVHFTLEMCHATTATMDLST